MWFTFSKIQGEKEMNWWFHHYNHNYNTVDFLSKCLPAISDGYYSYMYEKMFAFLSFFGLKSHSFNVMYLTLNSWEFLLGGTEKHHQYLGTLYCGGC